MADTMKRAAPVGDRGGLGDEGARMATSVSHSIAQIDAGRKTEPPPSELRETNYLAWFELRRVFLLCQSAAYEEARRQ